MTALLTREEYAAIAAQTDFPKSAFIDGKYYYPGEANAPSETLPSS